MSIRPSGILAGLSLLVFALPACGPGNNAAGAVLKKPELPTDTQAKCKVAKSQSEPLIVEWPETQRAKLESLRKRGLLAVHYEGCELSMLSQCRVKGTYGYSGITRKQSKVTIKDADELYASMPAFAVKLEGKLKSAGQLNVQMTLVGRYEAQGAPSTTADLEGECEGATHVVAALAVGAFTFFAGADAEVGAAATGFGVGGGGRSTANRELLQRDGDEASCAHSTASDKLPPEGCGAALQLEVIPIAIAKRASVTPAPFPTDKPSREPIPGRAPCSYGEHREGNVCVADAHGSRSCVDGEYWDGARCTALAVNCDPGERKVGGRCVPETQTPTQPPPRPPQKAPASDPVRTALGFGALGGVTVGAVLGGMAVAKAAEAKKDCNETTLVCSDAGLAKKDTAVTMGWISTIGLGVGALSGVGWLLWPSLFGADKTKVTFVPLPGGGGVSAGGKF